MHISLTETLEAYVRKKVATGLYNNASEVIREALRLRIVEEEAEDARRQKLLEAVDLGWQQAKQGEFANYSLERSLSRLDTEA